MDFLAILATTAEELPHVLESERASRSMDSNSPSSSTSVSTAEERGSSTARRQKQQFKQEKLKEFLRKHRFSEVGIYMLFDPFRPYLGPI